MKYFHGLLFLLSWREASCSINLSCFGYIWAKLPTFTGLQVTEPGTYFNNVPNNGTFSVDVCIVGTIGIATAVFIPTAVAAFSINTISRLDKEKQKLNKDDSTVSQSFQYPVVRDEYPYSSYPQNPGYAQPSQQEYPQYPVYPLGAGTAEAVGLYSNTQQKTAGIAPSDVIGEGVITSYQPQTGDPVQPVFAYKPVFQPEWSEGAGQTQPGHVHSTPAQPAHVHSTPVQPVYTQNHPQEVIVSKESLDKIKEGEFFEVQVHGSIPFNTGGFGGTEEVKKPGKVEDIPRVVPPVKAIKVVKVGGDQEAANQIEARNKKRTEVLAAEAEEEEEKRYALQDYQDIDYTSGSEVAFHTSLSHRSGK